MPAPITQREWAYLTALVNTIKSPNQFLKRFMWGTEQTVPTSNIEIDLITNVRKIAPFVRVNGAAVMVDGYTSTLQSVVPPNIRLKKPFTPSELLYGRLPGTVIFMQDQGSILSAIDQHMARDMQIMADFITNAEEYLCAQALIGTIAYSVTDQEVFTITFPRAGGNTVTAAVLWDATDQTTPRPYNDVYVASGIVVDQDNPNITDAICGRRAAAALRKLVESGNVKMLGFNGSKVDAGSFNLNNAKYNEDGVLFMGELGGINFWEYRRTATLNGTSVDMIRPNYVEFVSNSPVCERVMYYGAIADMKTLQGRNIQTKRFSKSWEEEDPSAIINLTTSRPLPVTRRPNTNVSMVVCA